MAEIVNIFQHVEASKSVHLVILLFSIFTGVGSGRLGELKTGDFYESIHDKDVRNSFGHLSDISFTFPSQAPLPEYLNKERHRSQYHRRNHKHHKGHLDFLELHKSLLDFKQDADIEQRNFDNFLSDIEKVKQNPYYGTFASRHSKKFDFTFINEQESWPRFKDIEILAGVDGWKKERWKEALTDNVTEKPKTTRTTKFTYRRVQSTNGNKRNAIIAVSAILQNPERPDN